MGSLTGQAKLEKVNQLLETLKAGLTEGPLADETCRSNLEELKVYGRDPRNAAPIFTVETVRMLCQYAFERQPVETSREAMRCLANTLLLATTYKMDQPLVQTFVEGGYGSKCAAFLKRLEDDDEFLVCRILFVSTYGESSVDFNNLVKEHDLAKNLEEHLRRHAEQFATTQPSNPMTNMALSENAKLLYNITSFHPELKASFKSCVVPLARIFMNVAVPNPPLEPPVSVLINALAQLEEGLEETSSVEVIFPPSNENSMVQKLIGILDKGIEAYEKAKIEPLAVPVVFLLRKIRGIAPESSRRYMESLLLPTPADRDLPIGQSPSLSSRLLRRTIDPSLRNLGEALSGMFFELSSSDPTQYVQNVGYGYAAGYLMSHNIALPPEATRDSTAGEGNVPVNPITGQRLDRETFPDAGPEMTEEEKEREAERLFVLFERLKATGVVNVENPVTRMMREGTGDRVQELDDSDSE